MFNGKANTHVANVPFDGPKLYIVLSGFHNPDLPAELLSAGVPLTCILEIQLSAEQCAAPREAEKKNATVRNKTNFFGDYHVNEIELLEFWRVTHERFANLSVYPAYSNITILTVRPSVFPEIINATMYPKRDMYDKVFLTLCNLYELCRVHAKYLESMKLEEGIDKTDETMDTKIYEDILNGISNEYIDVPLILSAILLQVEHSLATSSDERFSVDRDRGFNGADTRHENTSTTAERSPIFNMRDKLKVLDLEYELTDEYVDGTSQSSQPSELEVIPYRDTLSMIIRHLPRSLRFTLNDAVQRVLRDPRIISVWRNHEAPSRSKSDMYFCHIDNLARAFDQERRVSREEVIHYLHLLTFDRMIFPEGSREVKAQPPRDELSELTDSLLRASSVPNFTSLPIITSGLRRLKSDTEIDYCKPVVTFTECPLLFALTDVRETLLPGYLCENVFKKRSYERSSLEEYEDVELFSRCVFLQIAHECFQSFDRFAARYFEPTDSMLFYFSNNIEVGNVFEERCLSSIRTPVGLHEFCKYIVKEEENWIKREERRRQLRRLDLTGRFMKKPIKVEDDAIIFDDECFMLPDSLKTRHLRETLARENGQEKIFETKEFEEAAAVKNVEGKKMTRQKRNGANNGSKRADGRVMSRKTSMTEKKSDTKIDDVDTSLLSAKKILSSQCVETGGPYDFVGYDLGSLRVQVIHHSKKFLLDSDTSVRVEYEDWLHGDCDLRIAVTLPHCTLRLSGGVSRRQSTDTFHLSTKRGIMLGFSRNRRELGNINTWL